MTSGVTIQECTRPGCTFGAADGKCGNGLDNPVASKCPNLLEAIAATAIESVPSVGKRQVKVPLPAAGALDERRAYEVTAASPTRVIVVSGLAGSGKTTLLTSIYERLSAGPLGHLYFSGGRSPHAFEEWCHDGRLLSNRDTPDTPRTPHTSPGGSRFLHLRLATSDHPGSLEVGMGPWVHRDFLFTDLQGEIFERIRDSSDAAMQMPVFRRADHFVQLLDGEQLKDPARRHATVADAKNILRSCLDGEALTRRTVVHVVATKWDLVRSGQNEASVAEFFNASAESIAGMLEGRVADVRRHVTSARAPISAPIREWGAMELVGDWFARSFQFAEDSDPMATPMSNEFDKYESRVIPE